MAHNFNTLEGTEVINLLDETQGSHAVSVRDLMRPYKALIFYFSQRISDDAPIIDILENGLNAPIAISRLNVGIYRLTSTEFIIDKVHINFTTNWNGIGSTVIPLWDESAIIGYMQIYCNQSPNTIGIECFSTSFIRKDWFDLVGETVMCFPEIRIYL